MFVSFKRYQQDFARSMLSLAEHRRGHYSLFSKGIQECIPCATISIPFLGKEGIQRRDTQTALIQYLLFWDTSLTRDTRKDTCFEWPPTRDTCSLVRNVPQNKRYLCPFKNQRVVSFLRDTCSFLLRDRRKRYEHTKEKKAYSNLLITF